MVLTYVLKYKIAETDGRSAVQTASDCKHNCSGFDSHPEELLNCFEYLVLTTKRSVSLSCVTQLAMSRKLDDNEVS